MPIPLFEVDLKIVIEEILANKYCMRVDVWPDETDEVYHVVVEYDYERLKGKLTATHNNAKYAALSLHEALKAITAMPPTPLNFA